MIKTGDNALIPGIGQLNLDSLSQSIKPMSLTISFNAGKPSVIPGFRHYA
jgi:hypothetical protein